MDDAERDAEILRVRQRLHELANAISSRVEWGLYIAHRDERARELAELSERVARTEEGLTDLKMLKAAVAAAILSALGALAVALVKGG